MQNKLVMVNFTLEKLESESDTAQVHQPQQQSRRRRRTSSNSAAQNIQNRNATEEPRRWRGGG